MARSIRRLALSLTVVLTGCPGSSGAPDGGGDATLDATRDAPAEAEASDARIDSAVDAAGDGANCLGRPWNGSVPDGGSPVVTNLRQYLTDCWHNENTDLVQFQGAIYMVYRTWHSQRLDPGARLHVVRSTDQGATFTEVAQLNYPDRDIRDPKFVVVGSELRIYTLCRLPTFFPYDDGTDTATVIFRSTDGVTWSAPVDAYDRGWSFWREVQFNGRFYAAAYQDGDRSILFLDSDNGLSWRAVSTVLDQPCRITLEPEPVFFPDGRVLVAVRMDDSDDWLDDGHEAYCVADPPYTNFACDIVPGRLDGPRIFQHGADYYVITREHLEGDYKRTVFARFTGDLHSGTGIGLEKIMTLPSTGDTSYAGLVWLDADHALFSYYTSTPNHIVDWIHGIAGVTDIFLGNLDFTQPVTSEGPYQRDLPVASVCRQLESDAGNPAVDAGGD